MTKHLPQRRFEPGLLDDNTVLQPLTINDRKLLKNELKVFENWFEMPLITFEQLLL